MKEEIEASSPKLPGGWFVDAINKEYHIRTDLYKHFQAENDPVIKEFLRKFVAVFDHNNPLARGGRNTVENGQILQYD